ncbi:MAG: hypothetical protein M3Y22_00990 [Pseudomonadota bacterium]|nr:hypothetical protein [Pseudomonadota bacterium]
MIHLPSSSFARHTPLATTVPPPLKPAEYLSLRRKTAGLSIEQVAIAIAPRIFDRPAACALIRMLETPGHTARYPRTLQRLARIFPFDAGVYRQLVEEPADRHPSVCRSCGCSHWDPSPGSVVGNCEWSTPAMCGRCATSALAIAS